MTLHNSGLQKQDLRAIPGGVTPEAVGKILFDLRTANNLEFPKVKDKQLCFLFIMEQGCDDCLTKKGPRRNEKCSDHRAHISLHGNTTVSKADLQPLYKYLQNEHVMKQLVPTDAFKKFMS